MRFIGTAGWSIPAQYRDLFPAAGSQLERYASRLGCVEINSSFYRPHQRKTYERWAESVPQTFRFSVKVPRAITHAARLGACGDLVDKFLSEATGLGGKLGMLLVQLPPSLPYDPQISGAFFAMLRGGGAAIACEPRHASWFTREADAALRGLKVIRVAADPPRALEDVRPGGKTDTAYWRLHGSPRMYYSDYGMDALERQAEKLRPCDWCIFDNTAAGHALGNALHLAGIIQSRVAR